MMDNPDQFLNAVDRAVSVATAMVSLNRGRHATEQAAVSATASQSGLPASVVRRLVQPSRRPKAIAVHIWERLQSGYIRLLRRQLGELENEIRRVEALGPSDRAVQDLLDEATALQDRIRQLVR